MTNEYILALDPSGAFEEGKGTTGWCLMNSRIGQFVEVGNLKALDYRSDVEYWDSHLTLIDNMLARYQLVLLIEDYLLYAHKADQQINSRFETSQLIGVLKHHAYKKMLPVYTQRAAEVKTRWSNAILLRKGVLKKYGRKYLLPDCRQEVDKHALDAVRHAMHYHTFYNT